MFFKNSFIVRVVLLGSFSVLSYSAGTPQVSLNTNAATVTTQGTQQFKAYVSNVSNQAVIWSVNGVSSGNATVGTINSTGLFTAPATVPSANVVTVTATSVAAPAQSANITVTINNQVPNVYLVTPRQFNTGLPFTGNILGAHFSSTATVVLSDNTPVTITSRSSTQLGFAGTTTSPAGSALELTVINPGPGAAASSPTSMGIKPAVSVAISPTTYQLHPLGTINFWSSVSNNSNTGVTWSVNGVAGGSAAVGTISAAGVYTAPSAIPTSASVTVQAVSVADPTKSASCKVSLSNQVPVVNTVTPGIVTSHLPFTLVLTGTNFQPNAAVSFSDGTAAVVMAHSSTQITVGGTTNSPGGTPINVFVTNPGPGATTSAPRGIALNPPVAVTVTPSSYSLRTLATAAFQSKVFFTDNSNVTWSVNGVVGGNSSIGTISASGLYTAPSAVSNSTVTIQATSVADPTRSATATVTLSNQIPQISAVAPGQINTSLPFRLTITGSNFLSTATAALDDNTPLTIVSQSGTQMIVTGTTRSPGNTIVHLTVTNPGAGATTSGLKGLVVAAPVSVSVAPTTYTIRGLATLGFFCAVTNAVDKTVTWSVNGVVGGNAAVGTITPAGLYTAPAVTPASVVVTATSVADPAKSASATVTLQNPIPVITSSPSSVAAGAPASFSIVGSGFAPTAQARLGNTPLSVKWNSAGSLTVTTSGPVAMPPGGVSALQVTNPNPGAAASNPVAVTVTDNGTQLSYAEAKRFLEHATWGPTPASISHLQHVGVDAWLNEQFDPSQAPISTYSTSVPPNSPMDPLQEQFISNALQGSDQLRQRVAFALSQIEVVSASILTTYDKMMPYQQMLLNDAFTSYPQVIKDVTLSPGMGTYLNMVDNAPPTASASPNENFARELMQLMTVGLGQMNPDSTYTTNPLVPVYTEDDVRALARVFTGWTFNPCSGVSHWTNPNCFSAPMVAIEGFHDNSAKLFLGTTIQTGSAEGDLDLALTTLENYKGPQQTVPNFAPFISRRLIQHLVTGNPDPAYVARVAAVFLSSGGDLKQVVTAILKDSAAGFGNGGADLPADQGHLREPVLYAVSLLRALGATSTNVDSIGGLCGLMGQDTFKAPSIFSYYSPLYTISPALTGAGMVSPEFQTLTEGTAFNRAEYAYLASANVIQGTTVDLSNFSALASDTNPNTQSATLTAMLNAVSQALLGEPMPAGMLNAIMPAMLATADPALRARNAVFLVAVSPEYQVIR